MFDLLDSVASFCGGTTPQPVPDDLSKMVEDQVYEDDTKVNRHHGKNYDAPTPSFLLPPIVNPMDAKNYFLVQLNRPMGILFEENFDDQYGGAYVAEIKEGYSAAADGSICFGDQLIAIGGKRISGLDFDEVISVMEKSAMQVSLLFFRGPAASLYGPTGASEEWLDLFVLNSGGGGGQDINLASGGDNVGAASGRNEVVQESADAEARKELLDVVALAVATSVDSQEGGDAMNGDLFKAITATTGVLNLDADAVDDKMRAENKLVQDVVDADVKMEAIVEAEEAAPAVAEDDVKAEENAEVDATAEGGEPEVKSEKEAIASDEAAPLENEGDGNDAALAEDEAEKGGEVESKAEDEAGPEMETEDSPMIDLSSNHTKAMDWLDSCYENTANQTLSTALAAVAREELRGGGMNVMSFSNIPLPLWEEIKNRESSRQGRESDEAVTSAADGAAAPPDTAAAVLVEEEINNAAESKDEEVVEESTSTPEPEMQPAADAPIQSVPDTNDSDPNASEKNCVDFDTSNTADHSHYLSDDDDDLDLM